MLFKRSVSVVLFLFTVQRERGVIPVLALLLEMTIAGQHYLQSIYERKSLHDSYIHCIYFRNIFLH